MGVPGLYKYICNNVSEAFVKFSNELEEKVAVSEVPKKFHKTLDNLEIDGNALLHECTQEIHCYGEKANSIHKEKYDKLKPKKRQLKVFKLFWSIIVEILDFIKVSKILYLAIDGPCPDNKQNQQRQRRFVSNSCKDGNFNSNCISPGTVFMQDLNNFLNYKIREYLNDGKSEFKIIYSSFKEPGEGEHKLEKYIKSKPQESHCFVGPDGDLIMLGLATNNPKVYLLRRDMMDPGYYNWLDLGIVSKKLPSLMKYYVPRTPVGKHIELSIITKQTSNDFIFMGTLLGNDFLPKIRMFILLDDGLNEMIYNYGRSSKISPITCGKEISLRGLRCFINELNKHEIKYLIDQTFRRMPHEKYINKTLLQHVKTNEDTKRPWLYFNYYSIDYYKKAGLSIDKSGKIKQQEITIMCREYIKSLIWVYLYYVYELPSWNYFYPYRYAPFMNDLARYLGKVSEKEFKELHNFELGEPCLPFQQLMNILPETSKELLPESLHGVYEKSKLVEANYYREPTIDYEGVMNDHSAVVNIEFVNTKLVTKVYNKLNKDKELDNYPRNQHEVYHTFSFDKNREVTTYESSYGNIEECLVSRE